MAHVTRTAYAADSRSGKLTGIVIVVALHLLVLAALWQLEPVRSALTSTAPIVVSLVEPPRIKPEAPPKPLPPKPRVQAPPPPRVAPAPVITAAPQAPTPQVSTPPVPAPPQPESVPVAPAPAPVAVAPPAPPAPAPLVPPSFNANYLNNPAPAYPPISRRMGEEGKVVLRVRVNERGLPDEVQVKASSGSERLDMTALETVRHWKFIPARRGDTPVEAWVLVPISFSLRS
jgi:protein TonB